MAELIKKWDLGAPLRLTELQSKELLKEAGIHVDEVVPATSPEEAVSISESLGLPVVVKVHSRLPIDTQPSDWTGLPLYSEADVRDAYVELSSRVEASPTGPPVEGIAVQRAAPPGVELRVMVKRDPLFGPVLSFSFGRMAEEVWDDVTYRIVPVSERDARLMVREPRARRLLEGYRALEPPDVSLIEQTVLKLSRLVEGTPQVWEVVLQSVHAYSDDLVVEDARVELRPVSP